MKKILILLAIILSANVFALEPLPPYDWSKVMKAPTVPQDNVGNQVLHFKLSNKPYTINKDSVAFVKTYLSKAKPLNSDAAVLRFGSDAVTLAGAYIELGTGAGRTTNFLAALNPTQTIYSFDSFKGLPKDWDRPDVKISAGTFAFLDDNSAPPVLANVRLFKGSFADTLPKFVEENLKTTQIAFLHIDCDIYESTRDGFSALKNNIKPGTIIVLDELYNYANYENHEWKALQEFLAEQGYKAKFLAYNVNHEQVALKVTK